MLGNNAAGDSIVARFPWRLELRAESSSRDCFVGVRRRRIGMAESSKVLGSRSRTSNPLFKKPGGAENEPHP